MKSKQSEAAFNASLAARLQPEGASPGATSKMHMNDAPVGSSKSLDALLKDFDTVPFSSNASTANVTSMASVNESLAENGSSPIRRLPVQNLVDSPWQPRLKYDETAIQALGETLKARGQDEPIRVRPLANGKFELISGHRRTRAARLIGWAELNAIVSAVDDREAHKSTLLSNETSEGLSDFERALSYKALLDEGFAQTQQEVARLAGCTQGRISQCLSMLKLPRVIIDMLDTYPGLITYRHARVLQELLLKYPDGALAISTTLEMMIDKPEIEPGELKELIGKACERKRPKRQAAPTRIVEDKNGRSAFKVHSTANQIIINVVPGVDVDLSCKRTIAALRAFAETIEVPEDKKS